MSDAIGQIVVGTDGSDGACRAVEWAARLARQVGATVTLVRGYNPLDDLGKAEPPGDLRALEDRARLDLEGTACRPLADAGVAHEALLIEGSGLDAIAQVVADRSADLVVVGSHGETGWRELILGSVAAKLPHRVPCPVVIVPADRPQPS